MAETASGACTGLMWNRQGRPDWPKFRNWWPFAVALGVAITAVSVLPRAGMPRFTPQSPIALSVEASGQEWRVTWNPGATVIRKARNVRLIITDGAVRTRVELTAPMLAGGEYRHRPLQNEAIFRLEVDEASGHISAESFRLMERR